MIRTDRINIGEKQRDDKVRGLELRRGSTGRKYWYVWYRTKSGRERRPKIGEYPAMQLAAARSVASNILAQVALGKDPSAEWQKQREQGTLKSLCDDWKEANERKLKSFQSYKSQIDCHIVPRLGKMKLGEILPEDVAAMHRAISKETPTMANRSVAVLSSIYGWAAKKRYPGSETNPCRGIDRNREEKRQRYMKPEEAQAVSQAIDEEPPVVRATIRLLMLTGARRSEIAGRVLNRHGRVLRIGEHKTGSEKFIRLPASAVKLIEDEGLDGQLMTHPKTVSKAWRRIREKAGVPDLRLHDLRHTFASSALSNGVPIGVVAQLLGHADPRTTMRYAHLMDNEGLEAADAAAKGIEAMLVGGS